MKHFGIRTPRSITTAYTIGQPYLIRVAITIGALLSMMCALYAIIPTEIRYSWSTNNCISNITILPRLHTTSQTNVQIQHASVWSFAGYPLIATETCFTLREPLVAPAKTTVSTYFTNIPFSGRRFQIEQEALPSLLASVVADPVPVNGTIELLLDKPDMHFDYALRLSDTYSPCKENGVALSCDISNQALAHASSYTASVVRQSLSNQAPIKDITFATVQPIQIRSQSIGAGERVQGKPTVIVIQTDKIISSVDGVILKKDDTTYDVNYRVADNAITINLPANLPRDATYSLHIAAIKGSRNETLPSPYMTQFYLTPGPRAQSVSIGDRAVPANARISVSFDQKLASAFAAGVFTVKQNSTVVDGRVVVTGSVATFIPSQPLQSCAALSVEINGTVENSYGVASQINWQRASRVTCATAFSIGSSVEGRGIIGYSFGSGNREILYIGAIHGDEGNTKRLLDKWIYELEGNPSNIPAGTRVVVIPLLNPDGYAKTQRYNIHGVDLNRNFAANNWKSDIIVQGGQLLQKGGGEYALSEPESRAIADYITNKRPNIIASFHSKGAIVESNEAANANQIGRQYASLAGYSYKEASTNAGFFNYDVNGSLEEWAKDRLNQPVILIELRTKDNDEYYKNRDAMWRLL